MSPENSFDPMATRSARVDGRGGGRSSLCFGFQGVFSEPQIRAHASLMNSRTGTTRPVLSTVLLEGTDSLENWESSLVVQWLRICLPMQGTWVRFLVQEDSICRGATKPASCNY